ncbi:cytochrome p450 [Trichoderma arundinaceum]|uniref:Cytochrome p450 n=1 Tax=Trichoderma arundinaceum TaxID=490622 RepID=A0A395NH72_TRIAR|nr:cytochrome p450 [Trichoderma arundinaceum]
MASTSKIVFQLGAQPSFFESISARPNGRLLLTRQDVNELWEVDPATRTGKCIVTIPGVESLTGFCEVSPDVYAVGAGIYRVATHEGAVPGSFSLWIVDLTDIEPQLRQVVKIPEIGQLNGVATWNTNTVLAADSYFGKIYRINLIDGTYSVCIDNATTNDPPHSPVKMGVNGIKVRSIGGITYVYYTNTTRLCFCRVPVDNRITPSGEVEVLARGFIPPDEAAGTLFEAFASSNSGTGEHAASQSSPGVLISGFMPDDFCFDKNGASYVTTHPTNMVFKISPDNSNAVKVAGGLASWEVAAATACTFGRSANDENVLYISTAGANVIPIDGQTEPAKILFEMKLNMPFQLEFKTLNNSKDFSYARILVLGLIGVFIFKLHQKYGSLVRIGPREVSISDWKYYREIYGTNKASVKEPGFYLPIVFVRHLNLFAMTNKAQHSARRKIYGPPYSLQSIRAWQTVIKDKAERLAKRLLADTCSSATGAANAFQLSGLFSLEVICHAGFGKDYPPEETAELIKLLHALDGSALTFIWDGLVPWLRHTGLAHKMPLVGEAYESRREWERRSRALVDGFMSLTEKEDGYLLSPLLTATDGFLGRRLNYDEFLDEAMGVMFAGSGTTSTTLTYLLYALSRPGHKQFQEKLHEELIQIPKNEDMSVIRTLPYLNAVIKETMRLYPTIISSLPRVLEESLVVDGYLIPVGTVVNMQNYVHHRDPTVYPEPETFNPERWLDSTRDMEAALTPFSIGRRGCVGQNLAWDELYLATSMLFRDLKMQLGQGMTEADMEMEDRFNIAPVGRKLMLQVFERPPRKS